MRIETSPPATSAPAECEDKRLLWQHLFKLRWLRLDDEAERLAAEISALSCTSPPRLPPRVYATD